MLLLLCFACLPAWAAVPGEPSSPPAIAAPPALEQPPRIGVFTMEPGEVFFERFGHNAIVVVPADGSEPTSYNFGYFDMGEPDFFGNFIRGRMRYKLEALPLGDDLDNYEYRGRGVTVQWLDLDPAQARQLADALAVNALPENSRYTYDYYRSNCSTKVRDSLDAVLGGRLREQMAGSSRGLTYRSESVRLAWPAKWMATGFDVGLGSFADRPLSRWDEAFIPMRLRESLRDATQADGRPLVLQESDVLPHRVSSPPDELPRTTGAAFIAGLVLAVAALWGARRLRRTTAALALVFWIACGFAGALMLFIWFGTAHVAGHANLNVLLLSPLAFALLPGAWRIARGRAPTRRFDAWLWAVAGSAALAGFLTFLPFLAQKNLAWVLLLLPLHLALARGLSEPTRVR